MPSSHLQEMRQDHLGRLRPARQAGDGRRPGLPALRRSRQRPCRQRRLAAQALRPRLNRHGITPAIRTGPWCLRWARATSRIAPSLAGGAAAENYDLEQVLASRTPIVFGMLAALGFILLLVALGPPPEITPVPRPEHQRPAHDGQSGRGNPRSRPAAAYASTASGHGHTMATGDTAPDPFSRSAQQASSRHLVHRQPLGCHPGKRHALPEAIRARSGPRGRRWSPGRRTNGPAASQRPNRKMIM